MFNRARAIHVGVTTTLLVASFASPAQAETGWAVHAGARHTDNATLTDQNAVSDTITPIGGTIAYEHEGPRVQAALDGHGTYVNYLDSTFDDDFISQASGSLVFGILPETFLWTFEDTFGQIATDQFNPVTPDNRQNVNTFETGPDFVMRVGTQSDITLSGRYVDTTYEETDQVDSNRVYGSIAFTRHVSDNTSWGIVAAHERTKYDAPGDPEYKQPAVYATWQGMGARQTLTIDVGANRVEIGNDTSTKPLARVDWKRQVSPSWTLGARAVSEYRNTSDQFVNSVALNPNTAEIGISQAPAAAYEAGLSFGFKRARTEFTLEGSYSKLDYIVDNGLNEKMWTAAVGVSRRHTPNLESFLNYRFEKRNFEDNPLRDDKRQVANIALDWRAGRNLFLTAGYEFNDSDSDSLTNKYTANVVFLMLSFRQGVLNDGPRTFTN